MTMIVVAAAAAAVGYRCRNRPMMVRRRSRGSFSRHRSRVFESGRRGCSMRR